MRFDPTANRIAYTLGYGEPAASRRLRVVICDRSGVAFTELPGGHEPQWYSTAVLYARSIDGTSYDGSADGYTLHARGANQGDLSAIGSTVAIAPDRVHGVNVTGPSFGVSYPGTFEPSLSLGGTLAVRDLVSGLMRLERLPDCTDSVAGDPNLGAATRARWSSQTVVWDGVPFGRVYGRTSPDQPTVELTIPDHACTFPVPLWTGARLYVGLVMDDGDLILAEWGSLLRRESLGWRIGKSTGSAFDWDLAYSADGIRAAWLTPEGFVATAVVNVTVPPESFAPAPPDPPDPPDPEPPDPEPEPEPEPEPMPQNWPPLGAIPRDQVVMMFDAIDGYLKVNPRLGLPAGLIDCSRPTLAEQVDAMVAYGVNTCLGHFQEEGPLPGDAAGYDARRQRAQDYTVHVIENERGEKPPPPEPGALRGPIAVQGRDFTVPEG